MYLDRNFGQYIHNQLPCIVSEATRQTDSKGEGKKKSSVTHYSTILRLKKIVKATTILGNLCHFSLHYCCMSDHTTGKYCELFLLGNENRLLERFLTFLLPHGEERIAG